MKKAAKAVIAADGAAAEAAAPYAQTEIVRIAGWLSEVGDQPPMRVLCAAVIAAGLAGPNKRLARAGVRMIAAHTLATLAKGFVKDRVDRSRPRSGPDHLPRLGRRTDKEHTSFPSGHSAGAAAVARAYAREFPEHEAAALAGAGAIAITQIPRSAHYPTDVGVGLAIGWLSELAVDRLLNAFERPDEPFPEGR
ncbi:MAG: phosphatase PAP2 family protein [Sphingosinicella sp.]|nr:phosphatase PAP2 family protein [Sphingosinicella sp.]